MTPSGPFEPPMRIGDAERNEVVSQLRRHCGDGRLTLDEFSDRVGQVYAAQTRADLELVTMDLPGAAVPAPTGAPRRAVKRSAIAIMSGHRQTGRWRLGSEFTAFALWGGVVLDLRQAEIDVPEVAINAIAIMGGIDIIVPEGIAVAVEGLPLMGGFESKLRSDAHLPGQPVIRVTGLAFWGGVNVRTKGPKTRSRQDRVQRTLDHANRHVDRALQRADREVRRHGVALDGMSRPDDWRKEVADHASPDGTVTILFTDLEGYTEMTVALGDLKANELRTVHNRIVREQITACGGFEVKCQGDSLMIAFAGASKALRCAVAVQREFERYCRAHPDEPLRVHMGLHTGEVIKEGDDFLGRTVIVASRIAGAASGGEILASGLLKELADGSGEFRFDDAGELELKGLPKPVAVYRVDWRT